MNNFALKIYLVLFMLILPSLCFSVNLDLKRYSFDDISLILYTDKLNHISRISIEGPKGVIYDDEKLKGWEADRIYGVNFYYSRPAITIDIITCGYGTGLAVYQLNRYRIDDNEHVAYLGTHKLLDCHADSGGPLIIDYAAEIEYRCIDVPFNALPVIVPPK